MKVMLLLVVILAMGCGSEQPINNVIETERVFQPQSISQESFSSIQSICQAVRQKSDRLYTLSTGIVYSFDYSFKGCQESRFEDARVISAEIVLDRSNYVFSSTGQRFTFPPIETPQTGVMGDLCEKADLKNPTLGQDKTGVWFSVIRDSRLCQTDRDHQCLMIERGTLVKDNIYRIMSRELLRIRMTGPRIGFEASRHLIFRGDCEQGSMERKLVLR